VNKCRLRGSQEIKVAKDGRGIRLLHNAAGASGIFSLDSAVGLHHNRATTRWIDAMPALPGFHDHGPFSSLHKYGWTSAKAIASAARDKRGATLTISKQKSKKIFIVYPTYIISTKEMPVSLRESERMDFRRPFAPSPQHVLPQWRGRGTTLLRQDHERRLRGGRAAVKIRCLLGRSRLRRKRGRLFLRLGWRS